MQINSLTSLKSRLIHVFLALAVIAGADIVFADQQVFDSRSEQQLRPHDFDVKHYRIALSLEEETQSFDGHFVKLAMGGTLSGCKDAKGGTYPYPDRVYRVS